MNNSVFGAPGIFGGPSMFGAAELDPMFAASNPAPAAVMRMAEHNPAVRGAVSRGKGGVKDMKELLIRKAVEAWKKGDKKAALIHMASYANQKASTKNGFKRRANKKDLWGTQGSRKGSFLDWVDASWGKVTERETVTGKVLGIEYSRKKLLKKTSKMPVGYKAKAKKGKTWQSAFMKKAVRKQALARKVGTKVAIPFMQRKMIVVTAQPLVRFRDRRAQGIRRYPIKPAVSAIARLPRSEYRLRRQEILVDRVVEAVLERQAADANFRRLPYEAKIRAVLPLAQDAEVELNAAEAEAGVEPGTPDEEAAEIEQMDADFDAEMDADYDDDDEDDDEDEDEYAGVFGSVNGKSAPASNVGAAAKAAIDAIEADAALVEADAALVEADAGKAVEADNTKKMLMVGGAAVLAFILYKKFGR